jgi:hypothetical protein
MPAPPPDPDRPPDYPPGSIVERVTVRPDGVIIIETIIYPRHPPPPTPTPPPPRRTP